jgi:hypothetical protein
VRGIDHKKGRVAIAKIKTCPDLWKCHETRPYVICCDFYIKPNVIQASISGEAVPFSMLHGKLTA